MKLILILFIWVSVLVLARANSSSPGIAESLDNLPTKTYFQMHSSTVGINNEILIQEYVEKNFPSLPSDGERVMALSNKLNEAINLCKIPNRWNVIAFNALYPAYRIYYISNANYKHISFTFGYGYLAVNECDPVDSTTTSEPTTTTKPTTPTEPTEPTTPTEPTEPTEPSIPTMRSDLKF